MLGSLVIQTQGTPSRLPIFDKDALTGTHTQGRVHGTWFMQDQGPAETVYLPQRDKRLYIYGGYGVDWEARMKDFESVRATQYDKLGTLLRDLRIDHPHLGTVFINTEGDHGSWSLLRIGGPTVKLIGVKGPHDTQLVWSHADIVRPLRQYDINRYCFHRFFDVEDQLFLNTQALCSKWWSWSKSQSQDVIRTFNALEVMLFKGR